MKKRFLVIFMLTVTLLAFSVECFATTNEENGIVPCYTNTNGSTFVFEIYDNGQATFGATYYGNPDTFVKAKLTLKLQKRNLLFFWKTVDIGEPDNEWIIYNYDLNGDFYREFPLSSSGTYRAVYTLEVFGNTGIIDTIEGTREDSL